MAMQLSVEGHLEEMEHRQMEKAKIEDYENSHGVE